MLCRNIPVAGSGGRRIPAPAVNSVPQLVQGGVRAAGCQVKEARMRVIEKDPSAAGIAIVTTREPCDDANQRAPVMMGR